MTALDVLVSLLTLVWSAGLELQYVYEQDLQSITTSIVSPLVNHVALLS